MGKLTKDDIEQELVNLAKLRWKRLRLNPEYKKDCANYYNRFCALEKNENIMDKYPIHFQNFPILLGETLYEFKKRINEKHRVYRQETNSNTHYVPLDEELCKYEERIRHKWKIIFPVHPSVSDPNPWTLEFLTFNPILKLGSAVFKNFSSSVRDYFRKACEDDCMVLDKIYGNEWCLDIPSYIISDVKHIDASWDDEDNLHETKKIILEIDLDRDIKHIKHTFNQIISNERQKLIDKGLIDNKRKSLATMTNAIKVYRLRKAKKKWEEIAKEIFPEDFKKQDAFSDNEQSCLPNPESAIVKVKQYYKRAEELIREVP